MRRIWTSVVTSVFLLGCAFAQDVSLAQNHGWLEYYDTASDLVRAHDVKRAESTFLSALEACASDTEKEHELSTLSALKKLYGQMARYDAQREVAKRFLNLTSVVHGKESKEYLSAYLDWLAAYIMDGGLTKEQAKQHAADCAALAARVTATRMQLAMLDAINAGNCAQFSDLQGFTEYSQKALGFLKSTQPSDNAEQILHLILSAQVMIGDYVGMKPGVERLLQMSQDLHGETSLEVARALGLLGQIQSRANDSHGLESNCKRQISILEHFGLDDGTAMSDAQVLLSNAYILEHRSQDAAALLEKISGTTKKTNTGTRFVLVLNNLGLTQINQDQPKQAEETFRNALKYLNSLPTTNKNLEFTLLNNLALTLSGQSKLSEASKVLRQALDLKVMIAGRKSLDVALLLYNIANIDEQQGKYVEAEDGFKKSIGLYKELDPSPLAFALSNPYAGLAELYHDLDQEQLALDYAQKALEVTRNHFGPQHPQVAICIARVGRIMLSLGRSSEARSSLQNAVEIFALTKTDQSVDAVGVSRTLAQVLKNQHEYATAEQILNTGIKTLDTLGLSESDTMSAELDELASLYEWQERYGEASTIYGKSLLICKKIHDEDSPSTLSTMLSLAGALKSQKKYVEAERYFTQILTIRERTLGREHQLTANVLADLGDLYEKKEDASSAEAAFKRVLYIRQKIFGDANRDTGRAYRRLGHFFWAQNRLGDAENMYRHALDSFQRSQSELSLRANVLLDLADVLRRGKQYQPALDCLEQATPLLKDDPQVDKRDLATLSETRAKLFEARGDLAQAEFELITACEIRKSFQATDCAEYITCLKRYSSVLQSMNKLSAAVEVLNSALSASQTYSRTDKNTMTELLKDLSACYKKMNKTSLAAQMDNQVGELGQASNNDNSGKQHDQRDEISPATLYSAGKYAEAEAAFEKVISELNAKGAHNSLLEPEKLAEAYYGLGNALAAQKKMVDALPKYMKALEYARQKYKDDYNLIKYLRQAAEAQSVSGHPNEAVDLQLAANVLQEKHSGPKSPETADGYVQLAQIYSRNNMNQQATDLLRSALSLQQERLGKDAFECSNTNFRLADALHNSGQFASALKHYMEAGRIRQQLKDPSAETPLAAAASCAMSINRLDDALSINEECQKIVEAQPTEFGISEKVRLLRTLADQYAAKGKTDQAYVYFQRVVDLGLANANDSSLAANFPYCVSRLIAIETQRGNHDRVKVLTELLSSTEKSAPSSKEKRGIDVADSNKDVQMAEAFANASNWSDAIDTYRKLLEQERCVPDIPSCGHHLRRLAELQQKDGRTKDAINSLEDALNCCTAGSEDAIRAAEQLGDAYMSVEKYESAAKTFCALREVISKCSNSSDAQQNLKDSIERKIGNCYVFNNDWKEAIPFLEARIAQAGTNPKDVDLYIGDLQKLGRALKYINRVDEAEKTLERALSMCEAKHGKDSAKLAKILNDLGRLYYNAHRLPEAENQYIKAIHCAEKGDSEILRSACMNLASLLERSGKFHEAEKLYDRWYGLAGQSKTANTATGMRNYAGLCRILKKYDLAWQLSLGALEIDRTLHQKSKTQDIRQAALNAYSADDYARAEELFKETVASWGDQTSYNLQRSLDLRNLGASCCKQSKYEDAKRYYDEAIALEEKCTKPTDLLATLYTDIGNLQMAQKQGAASIQSFQRALAIQQSLAKPDIDELIAVNINIADSYTTTRDYVHAETQLLHALRIAQEKKSNRCADLFERLGILMRSQNQFAKAAQYFESEAQELEKSKPTDPQPYTLALSYVANAYSDAENNSKAIDCYKKCINTFGTAKLSTEDQIGILLHYGNAQKNMSDISAAEQTYRDALTVAERSHAENNTNYADLLFQTARLLQRQGRFSEAKPLLMKVLSIDESKDKNSNDVAGDLEVIAAIERGYGDLQLAETHLLRAIGIRTTKGREENADLAESYAQLAEVYLDKNDIGSAEKIAVESLRIIRALKKARPEDIASVYCTSAYVKLLANDPHNAGLILKEGLEKVGAENVELLKCEACCAFVGKRYSDFRNYISQCLSIQATTAVPPNEPLADSLLSHMRESRAPHLEWSNVINLFRLIPVRNDKLAQGFYLATKASPRSEPSLAIALFEASSDILRIAKTNAALSAEVLTALAEKRKVQDPKEDVTPLLQESARMHQSIGGSLDPSLALSLQKYADYCDKNGKPAEALSSWTQADNIWSILASRIADKGEQALLSPLLTRHGGADAVTKLVANSLLDCSHAFVTAGQRAAARRSAAAAIRLIQSNNGRDVSREKCATCLMAADLFSSMDDFGKARSLIDLATTYSGNDSDSLQKCKLALAKICSLEGDLEQASQSAEDALTQIEESDGRDSVKCANALVALGWYQSDRHPELALSSLTRASTLLEKISGPNDKSLCLPLLRLADVYTLIHQYDNAESALRRALTISKNGTGTSQLADYDLLLGLGQLYAVECKYTDATSYLSQALMAPGLSTAPTATKINIIDTLAAVDIASNNIASAKQRLKEAADLTDKYIATTLTNLSFVEQSTFLEETLKPQINMILTIGQDEQFIQSCYGYLVHWKGLLIDSLRRQTNWIVSGESDAQKIVGTKLKNLRLRIAELHARRTSLATEQWFTQNRELTEEKESLERELSQISERTNIVDYAIRLDTKGFQSILKSDELFVDMFDYVNASDKKNHYGAIAISRNRGPVFADFGDAAVISDNIRAWFASAAQEEIGTRSGKYRNVVAASASLSVKDEGELRTKLRLLTWSKIPDAVKTSIAKIFFCTDEDLSLVPWSVILNEPGLQTSQVDSPRELVTIRRESLVQKRTILPNVLIVGDVAFNQQGISQLPATKDEISEIGRMATGNGFGHISLSQDKATKTNLINCINTAGFVHLATHGYFAGLPQNSVSTNLAHVSAPRSAMSPAMLKDSRNLLLGSGLLLSQPKTGNKEKSAGILTAEELLGIDLRNCELITLSACETGRGERLTGQGTIGLRSCLMAAGPKSVLLSLWKVPDAATSMLMREFYKNIWQTKLSKAEALRVAQQTVAAKPEFAAPVNWAAWIIVGEAW